MIAKAQLLAAPVACFAAVAASFHYGVPPAPWDLVLTALIVGVVVQSVALVDARRDVGTLLTAMHARRVLPSIDPLGETWDDEAGAL